MKPLHHGLFKNFDKATDVTNGHLAPDGNTLHKRKNLLIPFYPNFFKFFEVQS